MFGCIVAGRLVQTNLQQVDVNKFTFQLDDAENINHIVVFLLGTVPFQSGYAATVHLLWPNKTWQLLGMLSNDKASAIFRLKNVSRSQSPLPGAGGTNDMAMDSAAPSGLNLSSSTSSASSSTSGITATLGISMEPIDVVQAQIANLSSSFTATSAGAVSNSLVPVSQAGGFTGSGVAGSSFSPDSVAAMAQKVMSHLYNHVTSFATSVLPAGSTVLVPTGGPGSAMGFLGGGGQVAVDSSYLPVKAFNDWYQNVVRKVKADPGFLMRE